MLVVGAKEAVKLDSFSVVINLSIFFIVLRNLYHRPGNLKYSYRSSIAYMLNHITTPVKFFHKLSKRSGKDIPLLLYSK